MQIPNLYRNEYIPFVLG